MNKEIEAKIKILALRDVEIGLIKRQIDREIIPDNVFEALRELEAEYRKDI